MQLSHNQAEEAEAAVMQCKAQTSSQRDCRAHPNRLLCGLVQLVKESRALCKTGSLHLHVQLLANNEEVLAASIPQEERAQAKDQNMAVEDLHIESWNGAEKQRNPSSESKLKITR